MEVALEVLFAEFGSLVVEVTVAVLVESDEELNVLAVTLIVMRAELPTPRLLREQLRVVVAAVYVQVPCDVNEFV